MARTTTDYAAIAASAPVNRQAALMRDGGGTHFTPPIGEWHEHWDAPPPQERRPSLDLPRLEGTTFGAGMRVVRYHGPRSDGARWLVRCTCGSYELRRTNTIRTAPADHACQACRWIRSRATTLEADRADPAWRAASPVKFKMKMTEAELRFVLKHAETALGSEILSPTERSDLAARVRDRISGMEA